jgi:hypothetical protein
MTDTPTVMQLRPFVPCVPCLPETQIGPNKGNCPGAEHYCCCVTLCGLLTGLLRQRARADSKSWREESVSLVNIRKMEASPRFRLVLVGVSRGRKPWAPGEARSSGTIKGRDAGTPLQRGIADLACLQLFSTIENIKFHNFSAA